MRKASVSDVPHPPTMSPADVVRPLSAALGTSELAINYFELAPGEQIGYGYHRHHDQEEVFYVVSGTVTFETESGDVAVAAGEAVRFAPGELQLGRNRGDERAAVVALGAPRPSMEVEYVLACPTCGERTVQVPERTRGRARVRCTDCGEVTDEVDL